MNPLWIQLQFRVDLRVTSIALFPKHTNAPEQDSYCNIARYPDMRNVRIISFYLLRTFCPHLGSFLCCFFFHYVFGQILPLAFFR